MKPHTFLWHDYETFGAKARLDRPAQFGAVRTDAELNPIGAPLMFYCRPAPDYLPDPESCLITGITPQQCLQHGLPEHEFARRIEAELGQPGTVGVGYNTIRFDDEFTRFLLWRNLLEPYAREWKNGCGRWDMLDVLRLCYALRPEGLEWPLKADGRPSFKLEDLARANGIEHGAAHDALSDVYATLGLARLLRQRQPRLFDFAFGLHKKDRVAAELGLPTTPQQAKPFLHVSGFFPPERGCLGLMWPLASHPTNRNELLAWDLAHDPAELATLNAAEVRARMFVRQEDLPIGLKRLPLKSVHLNKSPMVVANLRALRPELAQRWGIDLEQGLRHAERAAALPDLNALWRAVYERNGGTQAAQATHLDAQAGKQAGTQPGAQSAAPEPDPEQDLYGGFVGDADRLRLLELRERPPADPAWLRTRFEDERLSELVWRYRARNFPEQLSAAEQARWRAHCQARLLHGQGGALTLERQMARIDELAEQAGERGDERAEAILGDLHDYAQSLAEALS